jgi:hypothetical protein
MPEGTEWKHLSLTKTFRCGKAIVERQKQFCPDFEAAETNGEGKVTSWPDPDPGAEIMGNDVWTPSQVPDGSAILCRNNAPLVAAALRFLRAKRKVTVLGRDFAERLKKDLKKATKDAAGDLPILTVHEKVKAFYEAKLDGNGKQPTESELEQIKDRVNAVIAISEDCKTLGDLLAQIDKIFSDKVAPVTFVTGHKAKGLEWPLVVHLNPFLIPARWAETEEARLQEDNLRYVIETRARETLVFANLMDLEV